MATYNSAGNAASATSTTTNSNNIVSANVLSSSVAAAAAVAEHFERAAAAAAFILPTSTTHPLHLDTFVNGASPFVNSTTTTATTRNSQSHMPQQQHHQQQQQQHPSQTTTNSATSSYTFVHIKREPCQVSEVTTSNNCQQQQPITNSSANNTNNQHHQQQQQHHHLQQQSGSFTSASVSKTMSSSSTLTTLVKLEAPSPKVTEMEKVSGTTSVIAASTNNSVPIGIAVARKRPQESAVTSLNSANSTLPVQSSNLNKDLNCFGIRVADLGGVGSGCGNIYFTGNGDLMTGPSPAEELALTATGVQSVNRAPSTFWQYPNALPIESVISMSPATVGLQYSRDASRGQVVLLPATAAALAGMSNFPLYCTPTDPFQQAAAAFVWPSYLPQGTTPSTLQPPPNFIFPSMSPHSTLQSQPYATSLQLFGSNYLTAAAAAAAAAAATSTLCQHSQQSSSSSNGSINLSLGSVSSASLASSLNNSNTSSGIITANSCTTSSSRFLSVASAAAAAAAASSGTVTSAATTFVDTHKHTTKQQITHTTLPLSSLTPTAHLQPPLSFPAPSAIPPPHSLILPPSAMKIEEWTGGTDFMTAAAKTTTTTMSTHHLPPPPPPLLPPPPTVPLNFDMRDKHCLSAATTSSTPGASLLDFQSNSTQALNLMRLPTPPTSATVESAAVAAQLPTQLLFQATTSPVPTLLNLSATLQPRSTNFLNTTTTTTTLSATIGPPTPLSDDMNVGASGALNYKTTNSATSIVESPLVVGVPRTTNDVALLGAMPQTQDVNIQTDTPVCSEDECSSCPLNAAAAVQGHISYAQDMDAQQPLELTKHTMQQQQQQQQQQQNEECHSSQRDGEQEEEATTNVSSDMSPHGVVPADLTGLELLSNISTSKLIKSSNIRVKQEPLDAIEMQSSSVNQQQTQQQQETTTDSATIHQSTHVAAEATNSTPSDYVLPQSTVSNEPLGALDLLCALAEQRIQEEQSGVPTSIFATLTVPTNNSATDVTAEQEQQPATVETTTMEEPCNITELAKPNISVLGIKQQDLSETTNTSSNCNNNFEHYMNGVEEAIGSDATFAGMIVKRKKHKHSKKLASNNGSLVGMSSKKLLKIERKKNKKNKKKKYALAQDELVEFDEKQQLQEELSSAWSSMEPNFKQIGKWPPTNPQEFFNIMETGMRMRLADITRQYRKKKRKLDEISKSTKKKKKSAKNANQQIGLTAITTTAATTPTMATYSLSLGNTSLSLVGGDYKFPKFSSSVVSNVAGSNNSNTCASPYLNATNFMRFNTEKSQASPLHVQFPPPEVRLASEESATSPSSSTTSFKPLRLEPSALAAAENKRSVRLSKKHAAIDKSLQAVPCKERKLTNSSNNNNVCTSSSLTPSRLQSPAVSEEFTDAANMTQQPSQGRAMAKITPQMNNVNRELILTNEHLYRKETRVLTDMGGLFYAGILKPLQPPDVYGITLDGERGNKSHIMSREEVLKDTIIEVAPKSVDTVPVGTRLCAYWSQQYRCLYPGRAIESESSDEDSTTPRDFVSVEFDDGDSGRIRLQNIRLLLSDYPIAEYNDNPLYSLGKQKKSTIKTHLSFNDPTINGNGNTAYAVNGNNKHALHHNALATSALYVKCSTSPHINEEQQRTTLSIKSNSKDNMSKEQRSEKKRLKNLKKKAAAAAAAATSQALNASQDDTTAAVAAAVIDDNNRKHRKHKKRKKHKKHHHRKNNINNNNTNSNNNNVNGKKCDLSSSNLRASKLESADMEVDEVDENEEQQLFPSAANEQDEEDEAEVDEDEEEVSAYNYNTSLTSATAAIKLEANNADSANHLSVVKVKTENLFMDEETTSNLMSEMSDEMKGDDEIEHNNSKGSKIAAFLPDRQLWGWLGTAYRKAGVKGRARKQFYKTIKRGKETITVGESAVFLSTGRPDRPYIGRIESMWETTSSNKVVRVRWFYHPEETIGCPNLKYPGALFESPHEDENDVQTISHRCEVLPFERYFAKFGEDSKQYQSIYDNNDTYYLAGYYNPRLQVLKIQDDIPNLDDQQHNINYNNNKNSNKTTNNTTTMINDAAKTTNATTKATTFTNV